MKKKIMLYSDCQFVRAGLEYIIESHRKLSMMIDIIPIFDSREIFNQETELPDIVILASALDMGRMVMQLSHYGASALWSQANIILITPQGTSGGLTGYLQEIMNVCAVADMNVAIEALQDLLLSHLSYSLMAGHNRYRSLASPLSVREKTVIEGLLQGKDMAQIASELQLHYKTVSTHKLKALAKLGTRSLQRLLLGV